MAKKVLFFTKKALKSPVFQQKVCQDIRTAPGTNCYFLIWFDLRKITEKMKKKPSKLAKFNDFSVFWPIRGFFFKVWCQNWLRTFSYGPTHMNFWYSLKSLSMTSSVNSLSMRVFFTFTFLVMMIMKMTDMPELMDWQTCLILWTNWLALFDGLRDMPDSMDWLTCLIWWTDRLA